MDKEIKYTIIKNTKIPYVIKSYKNSKSIKAYFKGEILYISKPKRVSNSYATSIIKENEEKIYNSYIRQKSVNNNPYKKSWKTGEKISYKGKDMQIIRKYSDEKNIAINIDISDKKMYVLIPKDLNDEDLIKEKVDVYLKKIFKDETILYLKQRLPYLSKKVGIPYDSFKVQDAKTRFGSCIPSKKALHFSLRIIMLNENIIDAIIVHELCHIVHANHGKEFYNLVRNYIPDYDEKNKWLKQNGNIILF